MPLMEQPIFQYRSLLCTTLTEKNVKVKLSDVSVKDWKTVGMPAEAANAIDGDPQTVWTAKALTPLVVDMGKASEVIGFSYAPAQKKTLRERFISIISMLVSMARIDQVRCQWRIQQHHAQSCSLFCSFR